MNITLDPSSVADYERFLSVKRLPVFRFQGRTAIFPPEYANKVGLKTRAERVVDYKPIEGLFDYQADIARLAIRKRKFACFADCGLGKTLIISEFARHAAQNIGNRKVLIISPLMVVDQTLEECREWYGDMLPISRIASNGLDEWLHGDGREHIGITNYEALRDDMTPGKLGALILDESSMLKSHYGKYGRAAIRLGRGLSWKLAATGTPAPNDRIEYANHAVFLDQFKTINAFLARFFVNRGQTDNRWELKPHALEAFYRHLSHWSIFLSRPGVYGWKDNAAELPPINVHIHHVELTDEQRSAVGSQFGSLFVTEAGGITSRSKLSQLSKGNLNGETIATSKPTAVKALVESWPDESVIVWCLYNHEQDALAKIMPDAASISGDTPFEERKTIIDDFKAGRRRVLISKGKILGFGLNLQRCTRMVFSGLQDSYETFYQCVKRANRYGADKPLNVHIPVTELEAPMVQTVLAKARRVQADTNEQERIFADALRS